MIVDHMRQAQRNLYVGFGGLPLFNADTVAAMTLIAVFRMIVLKNRAIVGYW